jgi:hypothetical protein
MKARRFAQVALLIALLAVAGRNTACGWGGPHGIITRAALQTLPEWQRRMLGDELQKLGDRYCVIPDLVYSDKELAPYATMDSRPGVRYLVGLHLPGTHEENYEVLRYFIGKSVAAFKRDQPVDGARYAGTLIHALEDWGCPAHSVPGDNMFTLFKQFMPPPAAWEHTLLHGPIENGDLAVDIAGHRPRLLGTSIDEAAFNILHASQRTTINARAQVIPIIRGLYAGDTNAVTAAQLKAARPDAKLVVDALHTLLCLAAERFDPVAVTALGTVDLSDRIPLEATDLAMPQSAFFSKPFWGYARTGVHLRDGKVPVPLRLRVPDAGKSSERTFPAGIGTGTRSTLTYLLPVGVFARFETWAGLHAVLGATGRVVFEVRGNGRSLARVGPVAGDAPAEKICVPLAGVTNLQLIATSAGGKGKADYAVWGEPRLLK